MPHRPLALLFLGLFQILKLIVASPALISRGELWDDSFWGPDLDDLFAAGAAGAAGSGVLSTFWDFLTAPGAKATPSGAPSEQLDGMPGIRDPEPEGVSNVESNAMNKCTAEEGNAKKSWWQVEQEPETGRPVIGACDLPKDNDQDFYVVREIRFVEGRLKNRWPAAILVSDPTNKVNFRYNVIRVGKYNTYTYQKIPNVLFVRQGKIVQLGYVRRRGWLVGAGQSKEVALKWFEDEVLGTTRGLDDSIVKVAALHYSAEWIAKVIAKADQSGSPYRIPDTASQ